MLITVEKVLTNLRLNGVETAPLSVLRKRVLVSVGRKTTRGTYVAVVVPCKAVSFSLNDGVRLGRVDSDSTDGVIHAKWFATDIFAPTFNHFRHIHGDHYATEHAWGTSKRGS